MFTIYSNMSRETFHLPKSANAALGMHSTLTLCKCFGFSLPTLILPSQTGVSFYEHLPAWQTIETPVLLKPSMALVQSTVLKQVWYGSPSVLTSLYNLQHLLDKVQVLRTCTSRNVASFNTLQRSKRPQVTKAMSKEKIKKRTKLKPFIKYVNVNHIMPTR